MMGARLDSACKYLCERSGWKLSNLQLQKLLYLAQMTHMGRHGGAKLANAAFEAWDYGPVEPTLYHKAKPFGAAPVRDIFYDARRFQDVDPRRITMDDVFDHFGKLRPGDLVEVTHWDEGAWSRNYVPGARNISIPDVDILDEYNRRQRSGVSARRRPTMALLHKLS